jgi:hypothetical protein
VEDGEWGVKTNEVGLRLFTPHSPLKVAGVEGGEWGVKMDGIEL